MSVAVADTLAGTVRAMVEIAAAPEAVFRALTDPSELQTWWGSKTTYRTFNWKLDVRVGGQYSADTMSVDGVPQSVRGEYLVVDPFRALSYTWMPSWENFWPTTIRFDLEPTKTGTRVRLLHTGFQQKPEACKSHAQGWDMVLGWLISFASGQQRPDA